MFDENIIVQKLNSLFHDEEFDSHRIYFRKRRDRQPFFSSNIIAILNKCELYDTQLKKNIEASKSAFQAYQKGHLTYHWPLRNGESRIADSLLLSRFRLLALSPDADCTCLAQIAAQNNSTVNDIIEELIFYRADNKKFALPPFQSELAAENTFLTWFPPKEDCHEKKLETIDITVDGNILWFLGEQDKLNIPGAPETIDFIKEVLSTDLILTKPFELSPYYPYPLVILYHLSRAIHWGKVNCLYSAGDRILSMAKQVNPKSSLDSLLLASIGYFFKDKNLTRINVDEILKQGIKDSPIYVCPLFFSPAQRFRSMLGLAKNSITHIKFSSESFQWAILYWIVQGAKKDGLLN